jgi:cobalamin biosynthesis protein CbiD
MALSTFGAIMGFAAEMIGQTKGAYETLVEKAENPVLRETLQAFLEEGGKNYSLMEKTRRENVTEMILEPVTGLYQEDYEINLKMLDLMGDVDVVRVAMILEQREKKFFRDASSKVPLPEVARVFRKIAQKKEENLTKLQSLGLNQTLKEST